MGEAEDGRAPPRVKSTVIAVLPGYLCTSVQWLLISGNHTGRVHSQGAVTSRYLSSARLGVAVRVSGHCVYGCSDTLLILLYGHCGPYCGQGS